MNCLIIERHLYRWEVGFADEELPVPAAERFFGPGTTTKNIRARIVETGIEMNCNVSKTYPDGTRKISGLKVIGTLEPCFIFFQETEEEDLYDVWWQKDKAIVVAKYDKWQQGNSSKRRRGRLVNIVAAPVSRPIDHI